MDYNSSTFFFFSLAKRRYLCLLCFKQVYLVINAISKGIFLSLFSQLLFCNSLPPPTLFLDISEHVCPTSHCDPRQTGAVQSHPHTKHTPSSVVLCSTPTAWSICWVSCKGHSSCYALTSFQAQRCLWNSGDNSLLKCYDIVWDRHQTKNVPEGA